ncbi:MAG: hypothetical protein E6K91_04385 [Thaumarchaeota archaeon]|nr:MAG: hypothetical protein E6K91_04385 [Nitrososphaerota archaeon]
MHDSESDIFSQTSTREEFCNSLEKIGVDAEVAQIGTDEVEEGDYYSKHFTHSPAMVTNHGCIRVKGYNIDVVQIIQKG